MARQYAVEAGVLRVIAKVRQRMDFADRSLFKYINQLETVASLSVKSCYRSVSEQRLLSTAGHHQDRGKFNTRQKPDLRRSCIRL